jgi:hypothetical protein
VRTERGRILSKAEKHRTHGKQRKSLTGAGKKLSPIRQIAGKTGTYRTAALDHPTKAEDTQQIGLTMKIPNLPMSGLETCVAAVQIWMSFFLVSALAQIVFPDTRISQLIIILAGALAIGLMTYRWISRVPARRHLVNFSLLIVGLLIALDVAVAFTDL